MFGYMPILDVYAREILDSGGYPAIEVEIMTEDGTVGRAAVPSGISVGRYGTCPSSAGIDDVCGSAFGPDASAGKINVMTASGVADSCYFINSVLAEAIIGENIYEQAAIDRILRRETGKNQPKKKTDDLDEGKDRNQGKDKDKNREKGKEKNQEKDKDKDSSFREDARTDGIRCVSMAVAVTAAKSRELPLYRYLGGMRASRLPVPSMTLINGVGYLPGDRDGNSALTDVREFMIVPTGARSCEEGIRMCANVYHMLSGNRPAPGCVGTEDVLSLLLEAVCKAGYQPGKEIAFAIDVAANERFEETSGTYVFPCGGMTGEKEIRRSTEEMVDWLVHLSKAFPVVSIAHALAEGDREGWEKLESRLDPRVLLVRDFFPEAGCAPVPQSGKAIGQGGEMEGTAGREKTASALLVNTCQFDTLSELLKITGLVQSAGMQVVIACGNDETGDTLPVDLAVAVGATQIQAGMPCHLEYTAKYNRLLRIEDDLGLAAV